jgi:hypothetical protein
MNYSTYKNESDLMSGATAEDFKKWEQDAKTCTESMLYHIIDDCKNARDAMRGWNVPKENYYADQAFTYQDELSRRIKSKISKKI